MQMFDRGMLDSNTVNTFIDVYSVIGCCGGRLVALVIELLLQ